MHSFEKTLKEDKASEKLKKHDKNELALFEARIYEALGEYQKAVDILSNTKVVVNQVARNENIARVYELMGNKEKAIEHLE